MRAIEKNFAEFWHSAISHELAIIQPEVHNVETHMSDGWGRKLFCLLFKPSERKL